MKPKKEKIDRIGLILSPRRAMGGGHVEEDVEEAFEIIRLKINEIIEKLNNEI